MNHISKIPMCLMDGYDPLHHKTAADLEALAQFELTLADEGDIELSAADRKAIVRFKRQMARAAQ